jgi:membrane protein YqaA with SNARE-associated domain
MGLWASIIGLSMTPNLILGPSVAVAVGVKAQIAPQLLLPVVALAGYLEGLAVAWLAGRSTNRAVVQRWLVRLRTSRSLALADRWGVWGGLTLGCALLGQEPILVALRWLNVDMRRLYGPLAVSNGVFVLIYYAVVLLGFDQIAQL